MKTKHKIPSKDKNKFKLNNVLEVYFTQALKFHKEGNLIEAKKIYEKILSKNSSHFDALHMLGVIAFQCNDYILSQKFIEKAISIKPNFVQAYLNYGNSLVMQKKNKEALLVFSKALHLNPNIAEIYNSIGYVLNLQEQHIEAIKAFKNAIAINPNYYSAYLNLGASLQKIKLYSEALDIYAKAIDINHDNIEVFYNISYILQKITFLKSQPHLLKSINFLLSNSNIVRPINVAFAITSLLKFDETIKNAIGIYYGSKSNKSLKECILLLSESTLFLNFIKISPLVDVELEKLLKDIRTDLLLNLDVLENCQQIISFHLALALQCFTNEYIYYISKNEQDALNRLEISINKAILNGHQPNSNQVLCLASYRALHTYSWASQLKLPSECDELVKRQITEPLKEALLKKHIPVFGSILDTTSIKVKEQYEYSPYPRWVNVDIHPRPLSILEMVKQLNLRLIDQKVCLINKPHILMGGCGTGQNSIGVASRIKNSKMLAVDLSFSSLAYAIRKSQELGIKNIEYMQADILNLDKLNIKFDIVESSGVLHHMDDPIFGWKSLVNCLNTGGLMKIGLYSEYGRKDIVKVKNEIVELCIGSTDDEMKKFRMKMLHSVEQHHQRMKLLGDFYCLSSFRDLFFNVQEHRFTLLQIKEILSHLDLVFCGFEADEVVNVFKVTHPDPLDLYDLDKWHAFEENNPYSFAGMYQFWCQKL